MNKKRKQIRENQKAILVYLKTDDFKALRNVCEEKKITVAQIVRERIEEEIKTSSYNQQIDNRQLSLC